MRSARRRVLGVSGRRYRHGREKDSGRACVGCLGETHLINTHSRPSLYYSDVHSLCSLVLKKGPRRGEVCRCGRSAKVERFEFHHSELLSGRMQHPAARQLSVALGK